MPPTSLDREIDEQLPRAVGVLSRLVAEPSTLGREQGAQEVLAEELERLGFAVARLQIPEGIGADPLAGVPRLPYAGRYDLIATRGAESGTGPSLLVNGHIDVVPAEEAALWRTPPFEPTVVDGWLHGRGAADMKGGFAAGLLALWALDAVEPGWLRQGRLTWTAAIEEEYTGNGTLAAARAGHLADAALLLEPTELAILLGGVGIIWVEIEIPGRAAHAEAAEGAVNPILALPAIVGALRRFEDELNAAHIARPDPAFAAIAHPYNVNLGTVAGGDWISSVPALTRLGVRVGHPRAWTSEEAFDHVRRAVLSAVESDPWLVDHPPVLRMNGFRAEGHLQDPDTPLVRALAAAHREVHGVEPASVALGSTTDARLYVNHFGVPAAAYGPRTRNMHGTDEAVEVASIGECAKAVARLLRRWFGQ
ncbi:MAG: ArgE/DapE family deacylase [Bifidobacteriaceae bacterium]|jgi:acetylornithine deacetylase|nr:ArgE/DapE family deacylase [Bifidobacteriaceae bacterium]